MGHLAGLCVVLKSFNPINPVEPSGQGLEDFLVQVSFSRVLSTLHLFVPWMSKASDHPWDADASASQPARNKKKEVEGTGGREQGQSWEWRETEHSVCCAYEGRTWHKH